MMDRNDDVVSVYIANLWSPKLRDMQLLTIWVDNCSAQNKNWTLNQLEKGNVFMACVSFHHSCEEGI